MSADFRVYSLIDINPTTVNLTGDSTVLVRYYSTAEIVMDITGDGNINLDTCIIRNGNRTELATLTGGRIKATFASVESDTFVVSGEDSEGKRIEKIVVTNMVDYIKLTCNVNSARPNATGGASLQCSGNYFNGSFGVKDNTLNVVCRYSMIGGSGYNYVGLTVSQYGNTYAAYATIPDGTLNYEARYEFEFIAGDLLMNANSTSGDVATMPVFHWGENDIVFEVPVEFKNKGVYGLTLADILRFDNNGRCYIAELLNDELTIKAGTVNLETDQLKVNNNAVAFAEYGVWTPTIYATNSPSTASGWYCKCGNVVTIGFFLKTYCNTASNQYVIIGGLPFTPAVQASGGGMCSGATVAANKNFQCFSVETSGIITTRVQACNNTTDSSLQTSASGCYLPTSGEITLSGTITYMTY